VLPLLTMIAVSQCNHVANNMWIHTYQ
jgi:hypothetical protein